MYCGILVYTVLYKIAYKWNPYSAKNTNFNEKVDHMDLLVVEKTLLSYDQVG